MKCSNSNSGASREFGNNICSFYHLRYIYLGGWWKSFILMKSILASDLTGVILLQILKKQPGETTDVFVFSAFLFGFCRATKRNKFVVFYLSSPLWINSFFLLFPVTHEFGFIKNSEGYRKTEECVCVVHTYFKHITFVLCLVQSTVTPRCPHSKWSVTTIIKNWLLVCEWVSVCARVCVSLFVCVSVRWFV